jgi:hypothetical protein
MPADDARLEFYATPAPAPRRDLGPSARHRLHGRVPLNCGEIRVTSQPQRGPNCARIVIRLWRQHPDGTWWTDPAHPGVFVVAAEARTFLAAVQAAVEALENNLTGDPLWPVPSHT